MKEKRGFTSSEELTAYLSDFGINVASWGTGKAKTVDHLFKELLSHESQLLETDGRLLRLASSVNIDVYATVGGIRCKLVEDRQVFNEGRENERVRKRENIPGSVKEKLKPDEYPPHAVPRAVQEELGLSGDFAAIHYRDTQYLRTQSPSYPGLESVYSTFFFDVELGDQQVDPSGYKEVQSDKTTYFVWVPVASND